MLAVWLRFVAEFVLRKPPRNRLSRRWAGRCGNPPLTRFSGKERRRYWSFGDLAQKRESPTACGERGSKDAEKNALPGTIVTRRCAGPRSRVAAGTKLVRLRTRHLKNDKGLPGRFAYRPPSRGWPRAIRTKMRLKAFNLLPGRPVKGNDDPHRCCPRSPVRWNPAVKRYQTPRPQTTNIFLPEATSCRHHREGRISNERRLAKTGENEKKDLSGFDGRT